MSRAREEYESILEDFDSKDSDVIIKADNYIQELYKDCKYWESSSDYYKEKYENLEQQKAELIEFISTLQEYDFENIVSEQNRLLKKHGVEI